MRKSIATVSLSGRLIENLEAIAAAGFDGVEIFENDLLFHDGPVRDVRRYASDLGLTIDLFQPFRDFEGIGEEQHKRNLARAEWKFDLMGELGAPLIVQLIGGYDSYGTPNAPVRMVALTASRMSAKDQAEL